MTTPMTLLKSWFGRSASTEPAQLTVEYQPDEDLLFAWLGRPVPACNVEVAEGVYVRVQVEPKQIVGIEVLDCASRFSVSPAEINRPFVEKLIERYSTQALSAV